MAVAYLNENASSLAAANWSDTTGFADEATLVIPNGSVPVTSNVDFSSLTQGIAYLTIEPGRTGDIASAGTPLKCDVNPTSGTGYITNRQSAGSFHYDAEGTNSLCDQFTHAGTGSSYIYGGTVTQLDVATGYVEANSSTIVTNARIWGGRGRFAANNTGFTSCVFYGQPGTWISERDGAYTINTGMTLVLDVAESSPTITVTLNHPGARLVVRRCDTMANVYLYSGTIDLSPAERPITFGGSNYVRGPGTVTRVIEGTGHTISTPTWLGGIKESGSPVGAGI